MSQLQSMMGGRKRPVSSSLVFSNDEKKPLLIPPTIEDIRTEENALGGGGLDPLDYFLVPANYEIPICPVEDVGRGLKVYNVPIALALGVFYLAKKQWNDPRNPAAVRWAMLRMEQFIVGWFDHQPMTKYKPLPHGYAMDVARDLKDNRGLMEQALRLCSIIPFALEHSFRVYGQGYVEAHREELGNRVSRFMASALISDVQDYMPPDDLYGRAFRWIGVKRPYEVLRAQLNSPHLPIPFKIRANAGPSGTAIITTSRAVIKALVAGNYWEQFKLRKGYDDTVLNRVDAKIRENPAKYHKQFAAYGVDGPNPTEVAELNAAKEFAARIAPVLQAFIDVMMPNSEMSKAANANPALFNGAKNYFRGNLRKRHARVQDIFVNDDLNL